MNTLNYKIAAIAVNAANESKSNPFISFSESMAFIRETKQLNGADYQLARIDKLVRKHSAFDSMHDLLSAPNYRPTLYCTVSKLAHRPELKEIADYYDSCMEQLGDTRKVYRV